MKKILLMAAGLFFTANLALAQAPTSSTTAQTVAAPAADCAARAVDKNGKPLAGAAKASFMKKCEAGSKTAVNCEAKAVDRNGKALAGAAKNSFVKKCEAQANKAAK